MIKNNLEDQTLEENTKRQLLNMFLSIFFLNKLIYIKKKMKSYNAK